MHQPSSEQEAPSAAASIRGWYRFSWLGSLYGLLWLALGGLMAMDLSGAPDPYVVANLSPFLYPTILIGLATLGLQLRGSWLALAGTLGLVVGGGYVLTTIGFFHYGSPLPPPSLLKTTGLGLFLTASVAAIGVGLASSRSPVGRFFVVLLLIGVGLISLGPLTLIIGVGR